MKKTSLIAKQSAAPCCQATVHGLLKIQLTMFLDTFGLQSVFWQNEGHWQIPGLRGRGEVWGPPDKKHEVGYAQRLT